MTNFYLICQDRAVLDVVEKFVVTPDGAAVDKWTGEVSDGNKFVCGFRSKVFEDGTSYLQGFYGFEIEFCELSCMAEKTETASNVFQSEFTNREGVEDIQLLVDVQDNSDQTYVSLPPSSMPQGGVHFVNIFEKFHVNNNEARCPVQSCRILEVFDTGTT